MKSRLFLLAAAFATSLVSCSKNELTESVSSSTAQITSLDEMETPPGFNYRTTGDVDFEIQMVAPDGSPITGIPITINRILNDSLQELFTLITDQSGLASGYFAVPTDIEEVVVSANYIGIPNDLIVPITNNMVTLTLAGARGTDRYNFPTFSPQRQMAGEDQSGFTLMRTSTVLNYKYLSSYNSQGVPSVLAGRDVITSQMLQYINNSLPETKNVSNHHPAYLANNINTDVDLDVAAEVWVTFVHEGAGYTNSLCYYKYQTNNPPSSLNQVDTFFVVFPNSSYYNSGGGLRSGDKVKLGVFPGGTSIGFACISNGWVGGNTGVGDGVFRLFSDKRLNGLTNSALQQHMVMLYDNANRQYYFGFEDIRRDMGSCDNDFNDIVFYAKSNPITAISNRNMPVLDNGQDSDSDGVSDVYDDFPNDASLAYKNFLPAPGVWGTLAYEDLWPGKGDYDFNDLVLGYQFEQWTSASNKVKEMKCRFAVRAIGAHYYHGFGFQMNSSSSSVSSVTGYQLSSNTVSLAANQVEAGQSKATVMIFDNDYAFMRRASGNQMNTTSGAGYQTPDTITANVVFSSPQSQSAIGAAPFNPFIFVGGVRGKEIHLPGYQPTDKADRTIFGTYHDNTNPSRNIYYKTRNNLPFALNIPETFKYPSERNAINSAYNYFINWSVSGGISYTDWYKDLTGYRNNSKIY